MSSTFPRSRRLWIVALVVVVALAALALFAAGSSSAAPQYRTAVAATGDVTAVLATSAALQPLNRADLAFPVAGTVATVPVTLGQHVTPGAVLATLDTTALDAQVASAQSQQAAAEATLAADRSGQGSGSAAGATRSSGGQPAAQAASAPSASAARTAAGRTSGAAPTGTAPTGGTAPSGGSAAPPDPAAGQAVEQAAAAVTRALATREDHQRAADAALATARTGLDAATATCGAAPEPADPATDPGVPAGAADPTAEPTADPIADTVTGSAHAATGSRSYSRPAAHRTGGSGDGACRAALGEVLADQTTVSRLQTQVSADDKVLDSAIPALVTAALGMLHATLSTPTPPRTATAPAAAPPAPAAGAGTRVSTPASAERLAADQAAVDAAAAQVTVARQNRDAATLTSPIDGTVGSVALTAGQRVNGGSAAGVVVIGSDRIYQAQASVSETDVARIAVGDQAYVTPDGASSPVAGTVSSIALLPDTGAAGGAVTYPVTVALPGATGPYPAGQGATVSIRLADARGVLTVPTSAVHTAGARHTVDVLRAGRSQPVPVQVGAVGPARTQIVSGLAAGDVVVVADPSQPLPSTGLTGLRGINGGGARPGG